MFGVRGSVRLLTEINQAVLRNVSLRCQQVQCLRVGNAEIPNEKKLRIALQSIHGIGRKRAQLILAELSIENKATRELSGLELNSLREEVSKYLTGEDLKRQVKGDIQRLIEIQTYRGYRHLDALPCRGQRTRTNSRTRKDHSKPAYQAAPDRTRQSKDKRK